MGKCRVGEDGKVTNRCAFMHSRFWLVLAASKGLLGWEIAGWARTAGFQAGARRTTGHALVRSRTRRFQGLQRVISGADSRVKPVRASTGPGPARRGGMQAP